MVKQQHEVNMAKGPPGYVVRKSRDALWKFDVRGDPPLIETGNLTGFNNLSGLNPVMSLLIFSEIAGCNRPDGRGMPGRMMTDEGRMMNDRNAEDSQKMVITNCIEILKQVQDDKKKDSVRLDYFPEGARKKLGKQGFHRAPGAIRRMMNDEWRMMNDRNAEDITKWGLKPKCSCNQDPLPEGNGKGYRHDRSCCTIEKSYPLLPRKNRDRLSALADGSRSGNVVISQKMVITNCIEILKQVQDDKKKDCVRVDDYPEGTRKKFGKQGFHRAPGAIRRMMNGEWRMP